jgi:hypothetical protein
VTELVDGEDLKQAIRRRGPWPAAEAAALGATLADALATAQAPSSEGAPWTYRFASWPEGEIFRRLVDYEQDLTSRQQAASRTLTDRLSRWLGRRE